MARGTKGDSVTHARARALTALGLFALGTLLGARAESFEINAIAVYTLSLAGLVLAAGVIGPRRARPCSIGLCVLLVGAGWTMLGTDLHRPDRLNNRVGSIDAKLGGVPIEVRGIVTHASRIEHRRPGLADPPMWTNQTNRAQLRVHAVLMHESATRARWVEATGTLRVLLPLDMSLEAGQRVELLGKYSAPGRRVNPGEPDWAVLAAQQGTVGTLVVDQIGHTRLREDGGLIGTLHARLLALRSTLRQRAIASVGIGEEGLIDDASSMRSALLLGQREAGFDDVFGRFQRVGVAHVLAISGFHLALVVLMLVMCVRILGEHPRLEAVAIVVVLVGVMVLIPLRPPIVRAAVIVGAMLLATRVGRRYDRMTILAWVGLGLLIWRPLDAASMGYQLSMGVTALLVTLSDRRRRAMLDEQRGVPGQPQGHQQRRGLALRAGAWCWSLFKVNLACWAVALPVVVYHAGVVGVLAPIAAVVLLPMVALLMALGYLQILIGIAWPELAQQTMALLDGPSGWTLGLVSWIDAHGFAWVRVPRVSAWWAVLSTLVAALLVTRRVRWSRPAGVVMVLAIVALGLVQPKLAAPGASVRAVMLDVGDGSCVLLQSGGRGIVWDCGSLDRRVGRSVAQSARAMGITDLRDAIVTHDNLDHYNGLPELARHTGIERVWITTRLRDDPSAAWSRVRADLESIGVMIRIIEQGQTLTLGSASMTLLWPDPGHILGLDDNDTSAVALVRADDAPDGSPALLLTGDIEGPAMERLRETYPDLPAMLGGGALELPHHGSARSSAYDFVDWLGPGVVLQSTGPSRLDDDRWDDQRRGRAWYTTADHGATWVRIGAGGEIRAGWWYSRGD